MPTLDLTRRHLLLGSAAAALLAGCATRGRGAAPPPIVFVHGNGDSAALWTTTLWRFESNGWPRERLHAIDLPYPLARDDDTKPQDGRSSIADSRAFLAAAVERALAGSDAKQVVLIANSRGGNAVRSFIANGGADQVSHAILCGAPNHGVYADAARAPNNEFNGAGPFLAGLNAPKGAAGIEVTPGPLWLTIRSDNNDRFAQPEGTWIGQKGTPTNVGFDGPALKGAENVVIAGIDHRETAYGAKAFEQMFRFITGQPPVSLAITPESRVVLDGLVAGSFAQTTMPTNLPLAGASVEVYAVRADTGERLGAARHRQTIGADGRWGPFTTDAQARHEFVIAAPGYATTHIYRSPFPRSSAIVHLRAERLLEADRDAAAVVLLTRPRGYFGVPRDQISLDGQSPAPGIPPGVAGVAASKLKLADGAGRAVVGAFNDERLVGRAWPAASNEVTYLELTY
ncbi:MAG TPA: alpha/beta fold hydrolase [Burkholderiaceae bacterium]|nr:alpha/beta fold hydrolase [Burkholderiaceae bacterium]